MANISEFLDAPMRIEEFRNELLQSIFGKWPQDVPRVQLEESDWEAIRRLSKERYGSWDWNYGKSPESTLHSKKRFETVGTIDVRMNISKALSAI